MLIQTIIEVISYCHDVHFDGLMEERRDTSALVMELRLSCTKNPSILSSYDVLHGAIGIHFCCLKAV